MEDLLKRQKELQKEAYEVLDKLDLLNILLIYGKPEIVGSLATGLMTWRDIDLEVVKEINEEKYWQVVRKIFHTPGYKLTNVVDFRKSVNPNTPKGLHIGISDYDFKKDGNLWKIDIWFLPPRKPNEENYNEWIKDKITDENRKIILSIKNTIALNPKYRKEIFSVHIYNAVIEKGIKNLEGFKTYLQTNGKQLD